MGLSPWWEQPDSNSAWGRYTPEYRTSSHWPCVTILPCGYHSRIMFPYCAGLSRLPANLSSTASCVSSQTAITTCRLRGFVQDFLKPIRLSRDGQRYCTSTGGESNHDRFAESDCASRCHSIQLCLPVSTETWSRIAESNRRALYDGVIFLFPGRNCQKRTKEDGFLLSSRPPANLLRHISLLHLPR